MATGFIQVVLKQGPAVGIAIYMMWWSTHVMAEREEAMQKMLTEHVASSRYLSRQICINTAKDDAQVRLCIIDDVRGKDQ